MANMDDRQIQNTDMSGDLGDWGIGDRGDVGYGEAILDERPVVAGGHASCGFVARTNGKRIAALRFLDHENRGIWPSETIDVTGDQWNHYSIASIAPVGAFSVRAMFLPGEGVWIQRFWMSVAESALTVRESMEPRTPGELCVCITALELDLAKALARIAELEAKGKL